MLKNIIFDLDGTLWQTANSYIYAYHKLCELYNVSDRVSDDTILSCLGVKLDKFLPKLFPTVEDRRALAYRAMDYSIEYLLNNPDDCCYEGVGQLLRTLSQSYDVYIVSNCLDKYVETFMKISGTENCIKEFYTIESGEKNDHIERIAAQSEGKTLFVGDSDDDYQAIRDHYNVLFCYAAYGYKPCHKYAYKINGALELLDVVERISVKERQLAGKPYRVLSEGDNQMTLMRNPDGSEYFGFIQYANSDFDTVIKELKKASQNESLMGPIDGNTFYSYRFAVDNYSWRLYPDCIGDETLVGMFLNNGFVFKQYYTTTHARTNQKLWDVSKRAKLPKDFRVLTVSGEEAYKYVPDIYEVAVDAFARADFYEEISKEDFIDIYLKNLRLVIPDLLLIYDGDKPIAFNFCYEDPEKRFYVCKTTAIKRKYQSTKLIMTIVDHSYRMMESRGHSEVLHHFQNDRTNAMPSLFNEYIIRRKKYALMELGDDK